MSRGEGYEGGEKCGTPTAEAGFARVGPGTVSATDTHAVSATETHATDTYAVVPGTPAGVHGHHGTGVQAAAQEARTSSSSASALSSLVFSASASSLTRI
ncbi:hypothetical protein GA0115246_103132 [Streptomyces sp. SolWspMP-sol7th]|nr:hypothetical protein GA0115246_103132 [Streptomyces sp. SolWspMP-sol7th]